MAYYQFDLTFVNVTAFFFATPGFADLRVYARFSDSGLYAHLAPAGVGPDSVTYTTDTSDPLPLAPFQLSASDKVWFDIEAEDEDGVLLAAWRIGPYTVGDIGTEVPAP